MKKLSFAMFVIVGLFMLFSGFSIWWRQAASKRSGYRQAGKSRRRPRLSIRKHTACIL